jgi:hypothetical protein
MWSVRIVLLPMASFNPWAAVLNPELPASSSTWEVQQTVVAKTRRITVAVDL